MKIKIEEGICIGLGIANIILALVSRNWHSFIGWLTAVIMYYFVITKKG